MVSMAERDWDALRFLWIDDITKKDPEIVILRFTCVVFGVIKPIPFNPYKTVVTNL